MSDYINNNTTAKHATHFPRGVELIEQATSKLKIPNENWCYPSDDAFGHPCDVFYSEIWTNGMDYTRNAWMIYTFNGKSPTAELVCIEDRLNNDGINSYDYATLMAHIQVSFRNKLAEKELRYEMLDDLCFFKKLDRDIHGLTALTYEHASQKKVEILLNMNLFSEKAHDYILKERGNKEIIDNMTITTEFPTNNG